MPRVSSYDVFDTCLTRRHAHPTDVFYDVARRVWAESGCQPAPAAIEELVAVRVRAEKHLRGPDGRGEVTLAAIWDRVASLFGWLDASRGTFHELAVEADTLIPISGVRQAIDEARRRGDRIVFVSDMYLPSDFIRGLLVKHGLAQEGDRVYVSGDVGTSKATGGLFRYLIDEEAIAPSRITHFGDHPLSDYARPRAMGIAAKHVTPARFTTAESVVLRSGIDRLTASRIAGAMRAYRLENPPVSDDDTAHVTSQFIGPLTLAFASWVLQTARSQGIERLYFLSRDCQLVWKAADSIRPRFGDIDCRYLFISRQSIYLPSATAVSAEGMPWIRRPFESLTLDGQLEKLELSFDEIAPHLAAAEVGLRRDSVIRSDADWDRFWALVSFAPVRALVESRIRMRREAALEYFRSAGLFERSTNTLVDLGWYLTGQSALGTLLRSECGDSRVQGLYLALRQERLLGSQSGEATALFHEPPSDSAKSAVGMELFARQTLLEHVVGIADHRSVRAYEQAPEGGAFPLFRGEMSEQESRLGTGVQEHVRRFAASADGLVESLARDEQGLRVLIGTLSRCFFTQPDRASVVPLAKIRVSGDQNELHARSLAAPRTLFEYVLASVGRRTPARRWLPVRKSYWHEGDMAISSPVVRGVAQQSRGIRVLIGRQR